MNDAHERFQPNGQRTGAPHAGSTWGENIGDRRRRRSMTLVRARVEEIRRLVDDAVPGSGLVTGAATCAEVRIDERETTHRFIRVGLTIGGEHLDLVVAALRRAGWRSSVPGTDGGIIRIAHAHGRRPLFIVLDDPESTTDEDRLVGPGAPPATSPAGRAIRARRLRRSVQPPDVVLATSREQETELGTDIESLELQLRRR